MNDIKKRKHLSADQKWQIYQECEQPDAKIGEILRKHGLYSSDLQRIRKIVEDSAIEGLSNSTPGRKRIKTVPKEQFDDLLSELDEKEKALAEMSVLFTSLKKKVNLE